MEDEKPKSLRTLLLALPVKRKRTRKYVPPRYKPGFVDSNVPPSALTSDLGDIWRLTELSKNVPYKITKKYDYVVLCENDLCRPNVPIHPTTLTGEGTYRTDHLCRPNMRILKLNKKAFSFLGDKFDAKMNKFIENSWNSIYNYYKKGLVEVKRRLLARQKLMSDKHAKPKKGVMSKAEKNAKIDLWLSRCAIPKRVFGPRRVKKGKIADLPKIAVHMNQMAEPRFTTKKYLRPSIDPNYKDPQAVSEGAKKYMISDRTKKLATTPPHKLVPEFIREIGSTTPGARSCKASTRCCELAAPKKRSADKNADFNEDPFTISPFALKAKPSARTKELAKAIERK